MTGSISCVTDSKDATDRSLDGGEMAFDDALRMASMCM